MFASTWTMHRELVGVRGFGSFRYRRQTEPLIEYYRSRDKLKTVDADGSIDDVYERLSGVL